MENNTPQAYGIDYSNMPSPYYLDGDGKNTHGEANLNPFVSIYGDNIYENPPSSSANKNAIHRFVLNVAPLENETYPNSGHKKSLVNLDTIQLYVRKQSDYKFGKDFEQVSEDGEECYDKYGKPEYDSAPVPIKGAPIEFRKVYFQGVPKHKQGKDVNCVMGKNSAPQNNYYAYFACSNPVEQPYCKSEGNLDESTSGCVYNPRNEYVNLLDGKVVDWKDFDIGLNSAMAQSSSGITVQVFNTGNFSGQLSSGISYGNSFSFLPNQATHNKIEYVDGVYSGKKSDLITFSNSQLITHHSGIKVIPTGQERYSENINYNNFFISLTGEENKIHTVNISGSTGLLIEYPTFSVSYTHLTLPTTSRV